MRTWTTIFSFFSALSLVLGHPLNTNTTGTIVEDASLDTGPGRVHVLQDTTLEARSYRTMEDIFTKLCDNPSDRMKLSEDMHATMSKGWCGICIEKRGFTQSKSDLSINFKDVTNESNWNQMTMKAYARDCTQEKISGRRQLKMVQVFSDVATYQCVCNVHITCHDGITQFERSWITLTGSFLKSNYKKPIKRIPTTENPSVWCPPDCVMFGPEDVHGMNVLRDALQCQEDDECKLKHIQLWGN